MAIRLPVVLAQNARRVATYTDCEESWITSLLFEERLDATLVADLASIQPDSTDFLCLTGLKGDFVLVSWEDSSVVLRELLRLGFDSFDIVPVDGTAKVSSPKRNQPLKKIYLMGFNKGVQVKQLVGQLKNLLESKATPVFQLQLAPKGSDTTKSKALPVVSDFSPGMDLRASNPIRDSAPAINSLSTANPSYQATDTRLHFGAEPSSAERLSTGVPEERNFAYEDDDFPHIDSLVDELDRFDS
ncbi:MAG: hypothetical protein ACK5PB_08920 [Pirellula sp.]|jgi:hypothetical protein